MLDSNLLHAHLQVEYYNCVKFHKTPISRLGEVANCYTIVVHNLQMYMKEYRCCLKFRRGDNSTDETVLVSNNPTLLKTLSVHKNSISSLVGVPLTRYNPLFVKV
jgi:hypothetical protein